MFPPQLFAESGQSAPTAQWVAQTLSPATQRRLDGQPPSAWHGGRGVQRPLSCSQMRSGGQLVGLHRAAPLQAPASQLWPRRQLLQSAPAAPHWLTDALETQVSSTLQQVAQVEGVHRRVSHVQPALSTSNAATQKSFTPVSP